MRRGLRVFAISVAFCVIYLLTHQHDITFTASTHGGSRNGTVQLVDYDAIKIEDTCTIPLGADALTMQRNITAYERRFDKNRLVVLTMASSSQLELLQVWMDVPHRKHQQFVVLALDEETAKQCCNKNIPFLYDDNLTVGSGEDMAFMSEQFLKLGMAKFSALKRIVEAGYSIIFSEIDVYEFVDPEQCGNGNETQQQLCGVPSRMNNFDVEIQPNILVGKLARPGTELNIGFFYLRASNVSKSFLNEVLKCLENDCGWDQKVFTRIAWKIQCCFVDDNSKDTQSTSCGENDENAECLRLRVLSVYYFPTGGRKRKLSRPGRETEYGIVPPDYYANTKTCPTLVHCTGRNGLVAKMECAKNVQALYGNCSGIVGTHP